MCACKCKIWSFFNQARGLSTDHDDTPRTIYESTGSLAFMTDEPKSNCDKHIFEKTCRAKPWKLAITWSLGRCLLTPATMCEITLLTNGYRWFPMDCSHAAMASIKQKIAIANVVWMGPYSVSNAKSYEPLTIWLFYFDAIEKFWLHTIWRLRYTSDFSTWPN